MNHGFSDAFENLKQSEFYEAIAAESESSETGGKPKTFKAGSIIVNQRQRGNPLLKAITKVPWEYADSIIPDYVMGQTCCALFLSLRYHNLNKNYIHERLKDLGRLYDLRILLCQVDVQDSYVTIKEITKICLLADMTLILSWSPEEAGKVLETYKVFERKPPDLIMEKQENNPLAKISHAITSIKSLNRTDSVTLLSNFQTLKQIADATEEELSLCPGIGPLKAKRLSRVLREKFCK